MNLTINKYKESNLLIAEGIVEENSLRQILEEVEKIPSNEAKQVLLDCTGIKKLIHNRIGFSEFINHLLYIKSKKSSITLFGCDKQVIKLLKLLKLENAFHFSPTLDEAYLHLNRAFRSTAAAEAA